ncbi:F0F1 ATP synthase subunit B [Spiroplasma endosymbiont of Labia minor]|uniref:F0F1 ATP synthase subunit B n=1 Tax=Spiroplasma endosymbiont of Labia minor TaxID=3066305 RepID=UPI0030D36E08
MFNIFSAPGVPEVVTQLFPNLPNFIAHVLATIVIVLVLAKLVYKPFRKTIETRRNKINELLDDAAERQAKANKNQRDAELVLKEAKNESLTIVKQARTEADVTKMQIITDARTEATNLNADAKNAIVRERQEAEAQIRQTIIDTALMAASKVLGKVIDKKTNETLVDDFIKSLDK